MPTDILKSTQSPTVVHNTFVIERTYPSTPERVFAAFTETEKKRRWFADGDTHDVEEFAMDFRVGGTERAAYRMNERTPFPGTSLLNDSVYLDIVPNRRLVVAGTMTLGDRRISATLITFDFLPTDGGTELIFTHQGAFFEGADGPERREAGWRKLLDRLTNEIGT
jgi:uncharacterized protein YndB with AHSA1/START domain